MGGNDAFLDELMSLNGDIQRLERTIEGERVERQRLENLIEQERVERTRQIAQLEAAIANLNALPGGSGPQFSESVEYPMHAPRNSAGNRKDAVVAFSADTLKNERKHFEPESAADSQLRREAGPPRDGSSVQPGEFEITPQRLDLGDHYGAACSVWDASLFIGHPCLGRIVSLVLLLAWAVNLAIQVYFIVIVSKNMLSPEVDGDKLTSLLRFRLRIAHSVEFADMISHKSMASEVCDVDGKLHMSGSQLSIYSSVKDFLTDGGGPSLMVLAVLLWLCTVLKEMNATWSFARSLLYIPRRGSTRLLMVESDGDGFDLDKVEKDLTSWRSSRTSRKDDSEQYGVAQPSGESLITIGVAVRMTSISQARFLCSLLFVFLPRMVVAGILGGVGVRYLSVTINMSDLVLNCMALEFVINIDEILFEVFVPRRVHTLMNNMEPWPMPHARCRRTAGLHGVLKMMAILIVMVVVFVGILQPYFWRLQQAQHVLCSGHQDVVFAQNRATGTIHVTRSSKKSDWTEEEKILLQVIQPTIEARYDWDISSSLVDASKSNVTRAVVMPYSTSIDSVKYSSTYFRSVKDTLSFSAEQAAETLPCEDLGPQEVRRASRHALRLLLGNSSITSCSDVPWQNCSQYNLPQVRAICPMHCNCHKPPSEERGYAGYFRSPAGGCPKQCEALLASFNEITYMTGDDSQVDKGFVPCEDVAADRLVFNGACTDMDKFGNNPAYDQNGFACSAYTSGLADCDSADADDKDFSATSMCCSCGGGSRQVSESVKCLSNLTNECRNMHLEPFWFLLFVKGLFETLLSQQSFPEAVAEAVNHPSGIIGANDTMKPLLIGHVTSGKLAESMLNGLWEFFPGMPHPRHLEGCEYLTSFEIKALLNLDLCINEDYGNLKFLCPQSCGCSSSVGYEHRCSGVGPNHTCGFENFDLTRHIDRFSLRRDDLSTCPASCVLPHPSITGEDSWSNFQYDEYYEYYDEENDECDPYYYDCSDE